MISFFKEKMPSINRPLQGFSSIEPQHTTWCDLDLELEKKINNSDFYSIVPVTLLESLLRKDDWF
jgi:hypothetical protein